jgi:excisionase family DNA binding protein
MEISVPEFARAKGLSRGRILHLVHSGDIKARMSGGRWLIDESQLNFIPKASRSLSCEMQKALLQRLADAPVVELLSSSQRKRLEAYISQLKKHPDPALLLRSWVKEDEEVVKLRASAKDLLKLQSAQELIPAGASDSASQIFEQGQLEAYIERNNLQSLIKSYLLVKSESPNVILRVIDQPLNSNLLSAKLILNLSHKYGPRERMVVKEMINQI